MRSAVATLVASLVIAAGSGQVKAVPEVARDIGVDERLGERIPGELQLTDSRGRAVRLGDHLGDAPVVLVLAYNRCQMLCSLVLRGVADAVRTSELELGGDYRIVVVSIDPRDIPLDAAARRAALLETAGQPNAGREWTFLVGEQQVIRALADSVGFRYRWDPRTEQYAHPGVIFVLTATGDMNQYLYGVQYGDGVLDRAILAARSGEPVASAAEGGALGCFRFDPSLRTYWATIRRFLEAGALLIFAAVAFGIVVLIRRERQR